MLREILARFGIRVNTAPLAGANVAVTGLSRSLGIMGGLLAGAFLVRGLRSFITNMIDLGDDTAKTARSLGLSARELSAWQFAAERAGVPARALTTGFGRLQRNIVDANQGLSTAVRAFNALGVSTRDADGNARELLDIMPELADAFVGLTTDSERSARAQELFGRAGRQLLPFFEDGSAGIEELIERFQRLGVGLTEDFFERSEEAQDSFADFDLAMTGLKATIAVDLLPAVSRFAVKVSELLADIASATQGTEVWKAALIAIGVVAAVVGVAMIKAFIVPIAAILFIAASIFALILLVDDFITFLEGGESAIGGVLEALGVDTDKLRQKFLTLFEDQRRFWTEDFPAFLSRISTQAEIAINDFLSFWGEFFSSLSTKAEIAANDFVQIWSEVFEEIQGFFSRLGESAAGVAGFFGIEIGGGGSSEGAEGSSHGAEGSSHGTVTGSHRPGPAVRPAGGGVSQNIATTQNVTIDARGAADPGSLERVVRSAITDANNVVIRNAQRALTQVVD